MIPFLLASGIAALVGACVLAFIAYQARGRAQSILKDAERRREQVRRELDTDRREAQVKLKDELYRKRAEFEQELKKERGELEKLQSKVNTRYDALEKREQHVEEQRRELQAKEHAVARQAEQLRLSEAQTKSLHEALQAKLEIVSGMTREEARREILQLLEDETRHTQEKWLSKIEEEYRQNAKERSVDILVSSMQRYTADYVSPHSSGVVHLPSEDMKGRIIGKEGRNIKALELATGMEFVIGEPEQITISGFNPIRREVARRALEKLIIDGRINPTRIEEIVAQCEKEIDDSILEQGKRAVLNFNLQGVHSELITLLGKLHFRTSYSQNVLAHSIEVGHFARMIAEELRLPRPEIALRGGLLHDIGKALSAEHEGPHALIGADIAKRCGEDPLVVNAIAAHHEEVPFISVYSPIVMIADTISASRPGARRETLAAYVKRLEKLEDIAHEFPGVKKAFALQAGREVRVIVEEEQLSDEAAMALARSLARKIEEEMAFPGQIKVNVIREKRAVEYAR
jgi:ribonuclease Y